MGMKVENLEKGKLYALNLGIWTGLFTGVDGLVDAGNDDCQTIHVSWKSKLKYIGEGPLKHHRFEIDDTGVTVDLSPHLVRMWVEPKTTA